MIERKFVREGVAESKLDQYLRSRLKRVGFVGVEIEKTPIATRIIIKVERPGLVIGRKGKSIRELTMEIERKFNLENTQIKIEEVAVPELSPAVMGRTIAMGLEKGTNHRKVMHFALDRIMAAGAKGAEIIVSGKLVGKGGKAKSERVAAGYIKKAGDTRKFVEENKTQAIRKAGIIGIIVRIVPPNVIFPDKVDISRIATASTPVITVPVIDVGDNAGKQKEKEESEIKEGEKMESGGGMTTEAGKPAVTAKKKRTQKERVTERAEEKREKDGDT